MNKPRNGDAARNSRILAFAALLILTTLVAHGVGMKVAAVLGLVILAHLLTATLSTLAGEQQARAKACIF